MGFREVVATSLFVVSAVAFPIGAGAQTYASVSGGATLLTDADLTDDAGGTGEFTFDVGPVLLAEVGSGVSGYRGRVGLEFGYRNNGIDEFSVDGVGSTSAIDGDVETFSFMANGYYDFSPGGISPFVMIGLGLAHVKATIDDLPGDDSADDTVFAFQAGAGISIPLSTTISLDGSYRYFLTDGPNLDGLEAEYGAHNFLASLRLGF